jgi:hypothetical protein
MGHASPFSTFKFQEIFNDIKNSSIYWVLTFKIVLWRFGNPPRPQFPKWKLPWRGEGSFPHIFLHSWEHLAWLLGFPLGPQPYKPLPWLRTQCKVATLTPKVGVHLGVWRFNPSHSPTLPGAWDVTSELPSWLAPLQALALVASSKLGLR